MTDTLELGVARRLGIPLSMDFILPRSFPCLIPKAMVKDKPEDYYFCPNEISYLNYPEEQFSWSISPDNPYRWMCFGVVWERLVEIKYSALLNNSYPNLYVCIISHEKGLMSIEDSFDPIRALFNAVDKMEVLE